MNRLGLIVTLPNNNPNSYSYSLLGYQVLVSICEGQLEPNINYSEFNKLYLNPYKGQYLPKTQILRFCASGWEKQLRG